MRHRRRLFQAAFVVSLLHPALSFAQFEMDLSQEGPELRPSLAIIGIQGLDDAAAQRPLKAMTDAANATSLFSKVLGPTEVKAALGDGYAAAVACQEFDCLAEVAAKLKVDRLVNAQLSSEALVLVAYDWGRTKVGSSSIDPRAVKGRSGEKALLSEADRMFRSLATALGQIKLTTNAEKATVKVGPRVLGQTPLTGPVAAGTYTIRLEAESHDPLDKEIFVEPGKTLELDVYMRFAPPRQPSAPVAVAPTPAPVRTEEKSGGGGSIFKKPGLYTAVAGAALLGVAFSLGNSAKAVEKRATDANGDGVIDITRAEAESARNNMMLANIVGGAGIAAIAGGVIWIAVSPSSEPKRISEPEEQTVALTWMVGAHGTF
jgi:hypothetical protein